MQTLHKLIKPRNTTLFSLIHTTTLSPPQQLLQPTTTPHRKPPSSAVYDELIHEAGQTQNFRRLYHLLIRRFNDGCFSTNDTFRFITKSRVSIQMLDDLFDCLATLPEGAPRKNACDALVRRLCKIELIDKALQVLDEMRKRNLELNAFSFQPIFETLIKMGEGKKTVDLLMIMKEYGVVLDMSSFNYALREYCSEGDVVHAVDFLGKMVNEEGLKGDAWTYNTMVLGACKAGKVEGAMAVIRAAIDDRVKLIHVTYEHVIRALLESEYYEHAVKFVMMFAGKNEKLDNEIFDFLAIGLIKYERFDEAKMVVDEMTRRGLTMGQKLREFHEDVKK